MTNDVSFIESDNTIYLVVFCHESSELVDEGILLNWFNESEYTSSYLRSEQLPDCIEQLNTLIEKIHGGDSDDQEFRFAFAEIRDAKVKVSVARDKMSAKVKIEAPWQGQHANVDLIKSECKTAGDIFGVTRHNV